MLHVTGKITDKTIWVRRNTEPSGSKIPSHNVQTAINSLFGEDIWSSKGEPQEGDFTSPQPLYSGSYSFFYFVLFVWLLTCQH
jgi:hypothetical protein